MIVNNSVLEGQAMHEKIREDLSENQVVLYMKGVPGDSPCGYSSRMVQILDHMGVTYVTRNVLEADDLREEIKTYSGIKTLPQLFVNGRFVGGTDDVKRLFEAQSLHDFFKEEAVATDPESQKRKLVLSDVSRDEKIACAKN